MPPTISSALRRQVRDRAGRQCECCRTSERLTGFALEIDHIIFQARGGTSTVENLCLACRRCNAHKSYRTYFLDPQTESPAPLFNPRLHTWADHFIWSDDGTQILGQTAQGRATIEAFHMNDPLIVQTWALWVSAGWHHLQTDFLALLLT